MMRGAKRVARRSLVTCDSVVVAPDSHGGRGAFAARDMRRGTVVERGCVHVLAGVDGNAHQSLFRWGPENWAAASGCAAFYNCALDGRPNVVMRRHIEANQYTMEALRDIQQGEELLHVYESLPWRACFAPLRELQDRARRAGTGGDDAQTVRVVAASLSTPPLAAF